MTLITITKRPPTPYLGIANDKVALYEKPPIEG
jgi:hypothetical protein